MKLISRLLVIAAFIWSGCSLAKWVLATQPEVWKWVLIPFIVITQVNAWDYILDNMRRGELAAQLMFNRVQETLQGENHE